MALTITGKVNSIGNTISIASKNGGQLFLKREVVLDCTRFDPYTGERDKFENFPQFEFSGEKCTELDKCKVGDVVTISFDLHGSFYKVQDGSEKNFTRVRGYKVELKQGYTQSKVENEPTSRQETKHEESNKEDDNLPF